MSEAQNDSVTFTITRHESDDDFEVGSDSQVIDLTSPNETKLLDLPEPIVSLEEYMATLTPCAQYGCLPLPSFNQSATLAFSHRAASPVVSRLPRLAAMKHLNGVVSWANTMLSMEQILIAPGCQSIVFDIDETILLHTRYEDGQAKRSHSVALWVSFIYQVLQQGFEVHFVSARTESSRKVTLRQLRTAGFPPVHGLHLWPEDRPDKRTMAASSRFKHAVRSGLCQNGRQVILNIGNAWQDLLYDPSDTDALKIESFITDDGDFKKPAPKHESVPVWDDLRLRLNTVQSTTDIAYITRFPMDVAYYSIKLPSLYVPSSPFYCGIEMQTLSYENTFG